MCFCMVLQDYVVCFYPELKGFQTLRFPQSHPFTLRLQGSDENEGESEFRKFATCCVTHSPRLTSTDPAPNPSSRRCWAPMSLSFQLWRVAAWRRPGQCRLTGPWQGDCEPWGGWERIYINCFGDHQPFPSSIYRLSFARSLSLSPAAWCFIIKGFYCAVILPVVNQCNLSTGHRCGDAYGEIQSNNTQTVLTPVFLHCKTWWKETGINRSTTVPLIQALPQESIKAFGTKSHYCNNTVRRRWKKLNTQRLHC